MIRRIDPEVRVVHTTTVERLVEESIVQDRLLATLSSWFALLALLLSAVGLYGITSYGVQRRTSEIGVRMALGASNRSVQWMVLREVLVLAAIGAALGIPAALAASGIVQGLLFGLPPTDPLTVATAIIALLLVATVAGYLPARRAASVRFRRCGTNERSSEVLHTSANGFGRERVQEMPPLQMRLVGLRIDPCPCRRSSPVVRVTI